MSDNSYEELKKITDAIYGGQISNPSPDLFIKLLEKYGIKLRQKDGTFFQITYSIPKTKKNTIMIGVRYLKKDRAHTEDLFLFQNGKSIKAFYRGRGERELPEYKGTHKKQISS